MDRMSIIIPAHDSYRDMVLLFRKCLDQFWPDCPYPIVWTNGEEELPDSKIKTIHNGGAAMLAKRVMSALAEMKTKYILLWFEDYLPTKRIDTADVEMVLQYMDRHQCNFCALSRTSKRLMKKDPETPRMYISNANRPYGVSLNFGIFDREYLISMIKDENWTAWEIEASFLKLAAANQLTKCVYLDGGIGDVVNLLCKGKIDPIAAKKLVKAGVSLPQIARETLTTKQVIRNVVVGTGGRICPASLRKHVKRIAAHLGVGFASEY